MRARLRRRTADRRSRSRPVRSRRRRARAAPHGTTGCGRARRRPAAARRGARSTRARSDARSPASAPSDRRDRGPRAHELLQELAERLIREPDVGEARAPEHERAVVARGVARSRPRAASCRCRARRRSRRHACRRRAPRPSRRRDARARLGDRRTATVRHASASRDASGGSDADSRRAAEQREVGRLGLFRRTHAQLVVEQTPAPLVGGQRLTAAARALRTPP